MADYVGKPATYWQKRFYREFVQVPGQHAAITGPTGAGKTTTLLWMLESLMNDRINKPSSQWETIVWFDIRKSSELLSICCAMRYPVNFIIPDMMDIEIELFEQDLNVDYIKTYVSNEGEIWHNLDQDRVNIVCFEGFIRDIDRMVPFVKKTFNCLINDALDYKLKKCCPMAIFYDEFHNIAPSKGNAASPDLFKHGGDIQLNVEKLRSQGIRFVISCHKWTELRPGVRNAMMFILAHRGANFPPTEQPKLARFNRKHEKLNVGEVIIAYPNRTLSNPLKIPYYPPGRDYGYMFYKGTLKQPEKKEKPVKQTVSVDLAELIKQIQEVKA